MLSTFMLLGLGMLLGVRHALDPDHVIAVSTIVTNEKSLPAAARIGAMWGMGHTSTIFLAGSVIILLGIAIPPAVGLALELVVAFMLIALGAAALLPRTRSAVPHRSLARPLVVGSIHGLAGSAAAALLVLTMIDSPVWASLYLVVFGLGTVLGMMIVTVALAAPFRIGMVRSAGAHRYAAMAAGALSVAFGVFMVHQIGIVEGLFTGHATWSPH